MRQFQLKTLVNRFQNAQDFCKEFCIGEGDFILASKTIFHKYFSPYINSADVVFRSDFGSGEPNDEMIDKIMATFNKKNYKRVIAIGGGSAIDIAKLLTLKGATSTIDIFTKRIPLVKDKELIVIPTTCGSGSEVSCVSIAEIKAKGSKMGIAEEVLFPDHAVIIPSLLQDLPYNYFINSAIDALIHAMESFVSPKSNRYTELYSISAIEIIVNAFKTLAQEGIEARFALLDDFATASNYAGIAFGNTGTGAVHALSYPLSGEYHVEHGEANYQFFTQVFKLYAKKQPNGRIKRVNQILSNVLGCEEACVYETIQQLLDKLETRKPLSKYGMKEQEQISFADSIIESQQRLLSNAYVPLTREEIISVYKSLY